MKFFKLFNKTYTNTTKYILKADVKGNGIYKVIRDPKHIRGINDYDFHIHAMYTQGECLLPCVYDTKKQAEKAKKNHKFFCADIKICEIEVEYLVKA